MTATARIRARPRREPARRTPGRGADQHRRQDRHRRSARRGRRPRARAHQLRAARSCAGDGRRRGAERGDAASRRHALGARAQPSWRGACPGRRASTICSTWCRSATRTAATTPAPPPPMRSPSSQPSPSDLDGAVIEMTLSTSFGCPYEGPIDPAAVVDAARRSADGGGVLDRPGRHDRCRGADRGGRAGRRGRRRRSTFPVGAHLHDTRGLAIANALVAIEHGAVRLDAQRRRPRRMPVRSRRQRQRADRGPRPRARRRWASTPGARVDGLIEAARLACDAVGRPVGSHVGIAGPRFATPVPSPG